MVSHRVECRITSAIPTKTKTGWQTHPATRTHMRSSLTVATSRSLCLVCLGPQVHALSLLAGTEVAGAGLIEGQFLCNGGEELCDVLAGLGGGLEEKQTGLAGVLLGIGGGDGALIWVLGDEIELVAGKGNDDVLVCLALQFLDPCFCLIEGCLRVCQFMDACLVFYRIRAWRTACVMS